MATTWSDDDWTDIGGGTEITAYIDEDTGARVGVLERHVCAGGRLSRGAVPFAGRTDPLPNGARWHVDQDEPLTLSPSIACHACPHHGWIRDGQWVSA